MDTVFGTLMNAEQAVNVFVDPAVVAAVGGVAVAGFSQFQLPAQLAMRAAANDAFDDHAEAYDEALDRLNDQDLVDFEHDAAQVTLFVDNSNVVIAPVVIAPVDGGPPAGPRRRPRIPLRPRRPIGRARRRPGLRPRVQPGAFVLGARRRFRGRGAPTVEDSVRVKGYTRRFTTVMHTKSEMRYFKDHMVLSLDAYCAPEPLVPDNNCGIRAILPNAAPNEMDGIRQQMGVDHTGELDFEDLLLLCEPYKLKMNMYYIPADGGFASEHYHLWDDKPEMEEECKAWSTVNLFLHSDHWYCVKKMPYVLTNELLDEENDNFEQGKYDYLDHIDEFGGSAFVREPPIAESTTTEAVTNQMMECYRQKKPMFVIGAAGAGKTFSLNDGLQQLEEQHQVSKERHVLIVAMGGMAAKNCGGRTCHNAFAMRPSDFEDDNHEPVTRLPPHTLKMLVKRLQKKPEQYQLLSTLKVLVIDEICSLGYPVMHAMDQVLRIIRKQSDVPFGGVWLYAMGDSLQLSPVLCDVPAHLSPCIVELEEYYGYISFASLEDTYGKRYTDKDWARRVLPKIRVGKCDDNLIEELTKKAFPNMEKLCAHFKCKPEDCVVVSARNKNKHNVDMFEVCITNNPGTLHVLDVCLNKVRSKIKLCVGCKVMVQNNKLFQHGVCSGSIGTLVAWEKTKELNDGAPVVVPWVLFDGQSHALKVVSTNSRDDNTGFWYIPLILAWSLTVNKLQGSTVRSYLAVDIEHMSGTRSQPSAFYVSMSRSIDPKKVAILTRQAPPRKGGYSDYLLPKSMVNHVSSTLYHDWIQEKVPGARLPKNLLKEIIADSFLPVHSSEEDEDDESCLNYCNRRQKHLLLNGQTLHYTKFCTPPTCDQHMVFMDFETYIKANRCYSFKPYYCAAIYAHSALSARVKIKGGKGKNKWKLDNSELKFALDFKEGINGEPGQVKLVEPEGKISVLTLAEFNALENPKMDVAAEFVEWCFKLQFNFCEHQMKRGGRSKGLVNGKKSTDFLHGQNHLRYKPLQVMAFNMSGFDGSFILDYLLKTLHKRSDGTFSLYTINKGPSYVCIKVYKKIANGMMFPFILFKDVMLQVGPGSLKGHYKSWVAKEERVGNLEDKLYFPHAVMTEDYVKKICESKLPEQYTGDVELKHFVFPGTYTNPLKKDAEEGNEEAKRVVTLVEAGEYDVKMELCRYGVVDTAMLTKLAKAADEQFINICGVGISVMKTLANFSQYGFLCNLPIHCMYVSEKAGRVKGGNRSGRKKNIREFSRTKIFLPTNKLYKEVTQATRGGKTVCRTLIFQSVDYRAYKKMLDEGKIINGEELYKAIEDCESYPDVTSMYVYNQMQNEFPYHKYRYLEDNDFSSSWEGASSHTTASSHLSLSVYRRNCNKLQFWKSKLKPKPPSKGFFYSAYCFAEVDILCNIHALEPIFARRGKETKERCHWDSGLYKNQWLCCVDILTLLEGGAVILKIHRVIEYAATAKLFDRWAKTCFQMKQQAQEEGNAAKRQCGKTLGNATYGVSLRKAVVSSRAYLNNVPRPGEVVSAERLERAAGGSGVEVKLDEFSALLETSLITSLVNYEQWVTKEHGPLIVDHTERDTYELRKHLNSSEEYERAKQNNEEHLLDYKVQDIDTPMDPAKTQYMRSLNFIGAGILAHSRRLLASIIKTACPEERDLKIPFLQRLMLSPGAGDTDSLVIRPLGFARLANTQMYMDEKPRVDKQKKPMSYIGEAPGQSNDELYNKKYKYDHMKQICKIVFRVILACKCYYIEFITPDGELRTKCKIRGIPEKNMYAEFIQNRKQIFTNLLMIQRDPHLLTSYYRITGADNKTMEFYDDPTTTDEQKNNLLEQMALDLTLIMVQKKANFQLVRMKRCREHLNSKQKEIGVKPLDIYWEKGDRCLLKTMYNGRKMLESAVDMRVRTHFMPTVPLSYDGEGLDVLKDLSWQDYKKTTLTIGARGRAAMMTTQFKDCYINDHVRYQELKKLRDAVLDQDDQHYDQDAEETARVLHLQEEAETLHEKVVDLSSDSEDDEQEEVLEAKHPEGESIRSASVFHELQPEEEQEEVDMVWGDQDEKEERLRQIALDSASDVYGAHLDRVDKHNFDKDEDSAIRADEEVTAINAKMVEKNIKSYCGKRKPDEGYTTIFTDAPATQKNKKTKLVEPIFDMDAHGNQMAFFGDNNISLDDWGVEDTLEEGEIAACGCRPGQVHGC